MKTFILFLMFVPCLCLSQMKTGTFSEMEVLQKEAPKPVVIHLYTDWCAVCKIESFRLNKDKDVVDIMNEHFYLINFEAEKTRDKINFQGQEFEYLSNGSSGIHELALALSKNKNQPVYPLWVFLDKNQNLVYYQEGQMTPQQMKQKLKEISAL
ncbi:thioredoxin family protein [Chryseobacterium indologenes]|nr:MULTISPECIES: thioredoxin fold domain-containing protein [Chryseobacterium]ATN04208.1 thioredoxin family protein [Chryseobacterium indologenes]AYY83129.1 thioredoxin family protein [Chryseobacterium indologenes]AYZ36944.1 thioredoxin family protein [Chryseobacterium indologenes]MBF6645774.1 thioredoxin family protein [Chryseobacterium indologenes]MBU3047026.1 thioredoxin family protein [Chryseobacterium indologenes]